MPGTTEILVRGGRVHALSVEKFVLTVLSGDQQNLRKVFQAREATIGTAKGADLVLEDRSVSRHHAVLQIADDGFIVQDLGSTNGTRVDGVRVQVAYVQHASTLSFGSVRVRFERAGERFEIPLSERGAFGRILGTSNSMRELFAQLERLAIADVPVVLEGESGTGKELVGEELHRLGARSKEPFIIFDCSAVSPSLVESELFGHVKGAYTGAIGDRAGAFEEADGGTLFLDEIGELRQEIQPHLLRVLERGQVKRVGSNKWREVNVRVVTATHRDLRAMVADDAFREDLYYRLMVVRLRIPPLRERLEDLAMLVEHFVEAAAARRGLDSAELMEAFNEQTMQALAKYRWPGNVRELRNFVERTIALADLAPEVPLLQETESGSVQTATGASQELDEGELLMPYKDARTRAIERFDRGYLTALMRRHDGVIARAARGAGIDRTQLQRLLTRYDLRPKRVTK